MRMIVSCQIRRFLVLARTSTMSQIKSKPNQTTSDEFQNIDLQCSADDNHSVSKSTNEYLDFLSEQLVQDYEQYFHLNPQSQIEELNECLENLLTHMEEFYGVIERIRNDRSVCAEQFSKILLPKIDECQKLFKFVDKLEHIVSEVGLHVSLMEQEVTRAEKMMGANTNPVKKLFSSLISGGNHQSTLESSRYRYVRPDIFKTEDLIKPN